MKDILQNSISNSLVEAAAKTMGNSSHKQSVNEKNTSVDKTLSYMNENGKNFGTHDHSDFNALIQEKVDPVEAREFLNKHDIRDKNYFSLSNDKVNALVDHGTKSGYKKSRYAPGSYGRMYLTHLQKLADKADVMKAETAKKYNIKEQTTEKEIKMDTPYKGVTTGLLEAVKGVMTNQPAPEALDEAQGSFTRVDPMRKKSGDDWKKNAKKPRNDYDRTKRTVKEPVDEEVEVVDEAQGSYSRVEPMRKGARDDWKKNAKKPRNDYDRTKRTVKEPVDEEVLAELSVDTMDNYYKAARTQLKTLASKRGRKSATDIRTREKREAGTRTASAKLSKIHTAAYDAAIKANKEAFNTAIPKVLNAKGFTHVHSTERSSLYMHHDPETNTITTVKHIHSPSNEVSPSALIADSGRTTSSHNMGWANFRREMPNHEKDFEDSLRSHMGNRSWHSHGSVYESFEGDED